MTPKHIPLRISFLLLACGLTRVWAAPLPSAADVYKRADASVALVRSFPDSGTIDSRYRPQHLTFLLLLLLPFPGADATPTTGAESTIDSVPTSTSPVTAGASSTTGAESEATGTASGNTPDPSTSDGDKSDDVEESLVAPAQAKDPSQWLISLTGPESPLTNSTFKVFDWIDFAFALPSSDGTVGFQDESSETKLLGELVKAAHAGNTKVKLSVGGWTGSKDFSKIVSSEQGSKLIGQKHAFLYPGRAGDTSAFQKDDSANFLTFLTLLRKTLPSGAKISAAVQPTTFIGDDGQPMKDMSKFAKVLDWVTIMNYDVSLSSSTPGPNAPLGSCSNAKRPDANAKGGLKAWTTAGFPADQIVLGIASYGYISKSTAKELVIRNDRLGERQETPGAASTSDAGATGPADVPTSTPTGAAPGAPTSTSAAVSSTPADGGGAATNTTDGGVNDTTSGDGILTAPLMIAVVNMIMFKSLVKQGALTSDYKGAKGFTRLWDKCSSTPFLHSETAGEVVSYDDPQSIMLKGQFVKTSGMLGTNMWDINGDTKDWALMNAARKGMGLSSKASSSSSSPGSGGGSEDTGGSSDDTTGKTDPGNEGLVEQGSDTGDDSADNQTPPVNGGDSSGAVTNDQSGSGSGFKRGNPSRRMHSSEQ
ncbi:glycoside hydrolase superfamily [Armillaria luteobubalina]|uniref:Glycoside hydrolase superfamily n=1 Tax=Armillaria luteobubalina TaxID=153913 RepID=A0AA39Q968_9AGAR|nr:glycoside hydrolase superfamily [Armillaria luteobubalina]